MNDMRCGTCRWYCPSEEYCMMRDVYKRKTDRKNCEDYENERKKEFNRTAVRESKPEP